MNINLSIKFPFFHRPFLYPFDFSLLVLLLLLLVTFPCSLNPILFFLPLSSSLLALVRYVREDGKIHTVNLQSANLADGRTHSIILRVGGLRRDNLHLELYVNCRLADSSQGLPPLVPLSAEKVEIRNGFKAYARLQVTRSTESDTKSQVNPMPL